MLSKRILRSAFLQGHGANYRKLNPSEKLEAEKNFYEVLSKEKVSHPKTRNFTSFIKDLIFHARIPSPKQVPSEFTLHSDRFIDNYSWMSEEINADELNEYLALEQSYSDAILGTKWLLSKEIFKELQARLPEYKQQVIEKAGFIYLQDQERIIRKTADKEEIVISREELVSHPFIQYQDEVVEKINSSGFEVLNLQFSHDHGLIAVCVKIGETQALVVKDMKNGMTGFFADQVDSFFTFDMLYGLFYVVKDPITNKGIKCMRADFSGEGSEDDRILDQTKIHIGRLPVARSELIYEEPDKQFSVEVSSTLSGEYVLIKSDNMSYDKYRIAVEFRYRASNRRTGDFLIIQERKEGQNYDVKHRANEFYLLVSTPEEFNGTVLKLEIPPYSAFNPPKDPPVQAQTTELQSKFLGAKVHFPHNPQAYIEHIESYQDHLVSILTDTETSLQHLQVDNFKSNSTDIVAYDKYEGALKVANNKSYRIKLAGDCQDYFDKSFKYYLSTLHCPEQMISYDLETRLNQLIDYNFTVPGVQLQDYTSERIVLPANDGKLIPVTLIYHKRNVKTGNNAVGIVESYGGEIEHSHNFQLDYSWYSLLDRGFMWIIPHVRGSNDVNSTWYEKGTERRKIRHIQDLLDVIVSLVSEKILTGVGAYSCTPSGGLALGSLIVKEPSLLSAVVMRVIFMQNPLLDVFEHLKNKRTVSEFGDVNDPEVYKVIRSYSPYQQRFPKEFCPTMLTADFDSDFAFHAMKFLAKSREHKHAATVIYKEYPTWTHEEVKKAEEYSFLIDNTRIKK